MRACLVDLLVSADVHQNVEALGSPRRPWSEGKKVEPQITQNTQRTTVPHKPRTMRLSGTVRAQPIIRLDKKLTHLIHGIVGKCQNIMPGQYVMQNQLVADFATSVVSDSLSPLDFMLTGLFRQHLLGIASPSIPLRISA
jgi:hypothetical protein